MRGSRMLLTIALLMAPIAGQAQTQIENQSLAPDRIELYAEMWALAGVCGRLASHTVEQDELLVRLNADLDQVSDASFAEVEALHARKREEVSAQTQAVAAMPRGPQRQEASDRVTGDLMTRCLRLAEDPLAGDYFRSHLNR